MEVLLLIKALLFFWIWFLPFFCYRSTTKQDDTSDSNEQKNLNTTIDMDLVEEKEATGERQEVKAEAKSFMCINVENSKDPPADKTNGGVDLGQFLDVTERRPSLFSQKAGRRKFTVRSIKNLTRTTPDPQPPYPQTPYPQPQQQYPQQPTYPPYPSYPHPQYQQHPAPMFTRQLWRQGPPPEQQQQGWGQGNQDQGPGYGRYDGYGHTPLEYDPRSRNSFVAFVMGIVFAMLAATAAFLATVLAVPEVKEFFETSGWLIVFPAMIGLLIVNYAMMCSPCARRPPCNFCMLILATVCMSIIAAKISSHFRTEIILYAVVATGAAVFVCIILACSKFDFTSWMLYVIMISAGFSVIVMIVLLAAMFTGNMMKPILIVILVIGTVIQIVMLIMQLQMILGGRTIELSESDYAIAALMLYTSIIDIFLKLLLILGILDR